MHEESTSTHLLPHVRERTAQLLLALLGGALATLAFTVVGTPEVRLVALIGVGLLVGTLVALALRGGRFVASPAVGGLASAHELSIERRVPARDHAGDRLVRYAWMRAPVCSEDAAGRRSPSELTPVTIVRVHSEQERRRVEALKPPGMVLHAIVVDPEAPPAPARDVAQPEVSR
jgi:hypothetical protein